MSNTKRGGTNLGGSEVYCNHRRITFYAISGKTEPENWVINPKNTEQAVTIGTTILPRVRKYSKELLQENMKVFAF
jgi:hypothetical protein